jgi:predicted nucleic acid-binding Zn ribbon protein
MTQNPGQITIRSHSIGVCSVCQTTFEFTPGKRKRVTCSNKCRGIKYFMENEIARRRQTLINSRGRLLLKLGRVEEELKSLGWREHE